MTKSNKMNEWREDLSPIARWNEICNFHRTIPTKEDHDDFLFEMQKRIEQTKDKQFIELLERSPKIKTVDFEKCETVGEQLNLTINMLRKLAVWEKQAKKQFNLKE